MTGAKRDRKIVQLLGFDTDVNARLIMTPLLQRLAEVFQYRPKCVKDDFGPLHIGGLC